MYIAKRGIAPTQQWMPVYRSTTIYNNSLVEMSNEGVIPMTVADNTDDSDDNTYCMGIVIANNLAEPLYNSTYKEEYITAGAAADAHDGSAIKYRGVSGPYANGDASNRAMVLVEKIYPFTVLRAPLYNGAVGTAPSLLTATNTDGNGTAITTNSTDHTPADLKSSIYCRTGANAGAYRITSGTDDAALTWDVAMKYDIAAGDTFVCVPLRPFGDSYIDFGTEPGCTYIDVGEDPVTEYFQIDVVRLDLRVAGEEFVEFTMSPNTLNFGRANV